MDVQTLARTARENLSRGLGALQSPGLPEHIGQIAEPIAAAMSSLHQVERTGGVGTVESANAALAYVRQALSQLQTAGVAHAAVDQAMEAIAGSLSLVHQLSVQVGNASMVPSPPTQHSSTFRTAPEPQPHVAVVGQAPQQQPPWPAQAPAPVNPNGPTQLAPGWAQATQPAAAAPVAAAHQAPPQPAPAYQPPPQPAPAYQPPPQPAAVQHAPHQVPPPAAGAPAPHGPASNAIRVEAELGAHSTTNFYKGLSGNDVIDSGGIFIATYQIPRVGQELVIRVSMPGGYEFEAMGVVRWSRDAPSSGGADSSPGFGAQFTSITPEARQLVYRYVRNREPLFHDDF
jgi:hypothetical protein